MKVALENLENSRVRLSVEVDAEMLEEGLQHAYRKVVKKVTIPGFRKGKVPRPILVRTYGEEVLYEDAIDHVLPQAYTEAVEETAINPIDQPEIDLDRIEPGVGFKFRAEVDVFPTVCLGEYKELAVDKVIETVTEESVDQALVNLQERHAELVTVDSRLQVQAGDHAVIDFKGFIDGQPFSGGAADDHMLEIGSGQFIPGFEEQLVGINIGEDKDVIVSFPQDYGNSDLAGKEAVFKVKVKSLKERVVPELDDDFAKDTSEKDTLAELRIDIRENLKNAAAGRTKADLENKLIEKVIANSSMEIPKIMISRQTDQLVNDFRNRLMYQGMQLEGYLEYTGKTMAEMETEMQPDAIFQIQRDLLLEEIAKKEGISASDEEIIRRIDELLGEDATPKDRAQLEERKDWIATSLKMAKVTALLVENAVITEVAAEVTAEVTEDE